ncbi:MAG: hypothetical protein JO199_12305 [Candidatus Eremiobacteraeota bacterium]|nr:hypothetical protein [Candidatus Eremiobacteraeota bacterium]
MPNERVAVGVDAGGSSVHVSIDGEPADVTHSPANATTYGIERVASTIGDAVERALKHRRAAAIVVGAAGTGRESVANALQAALSMRFSQSNVRVVDDAKIALRAVAGGGDGIVLIAGTGSIAYGEISGARYRAGGYGYAFGDDGSGYAIGSAALRLLARSFEGRAPRDSMLDAIAAVLEAASVQELVARVYASESPVRTVAEIAPVVIEFAGRSERSAAKIVQAAALELSDLVRTVWRLAAIGDREVPLGLSGGLLNAENSLLSYLLETRLANELPHARIEKRFSAVDGAVAMARELMQAT